MRPNTEFIILNDDDTYSSLRRCSYVDPNGRVYDLEILLHHSSIVTQVEAWKDARLTDSIADKIKNNINHGELGKP